MVLSFHKEALQQLVDEDGLLVLAPGLGIDVILFHLVRMYASSRLLLLLNASQEQECALVEACVAEEAGEVPIIVNAETPASRRVGLYQRGKGCLCVSARVLTVDLLSKRVPDTAVGGVVVCAAHTVTPTSQMAFIMKLFREANKTAFVKAITDNPVGMTRQFRQVEKALKTLFLTRLYIWPRFHAGVADSLVAAPEVIEMTQQLTPSMKKIQEAILKSLDSCFHELKRTNPNVDLSKLSVRDSLHKSFEFALRSELEPIWHKLSPKTRELVNSMETLRRLSGYLFEYDAVSFCQFLETLLSSLDSHSPLLLMDTTQAIVRHSRARVFHLGRHVKEAATPKPAQASVCEVEVITPRKSGECDAQAHDGNADQEEGQDPDRDDLNRGDGRTVFIDQGFQLRVTLEQNPKCDLLVAVLEEISRTDPGPHRAPVVVLVQNEFTATHLHDTLVHGSEQMLRRRLRTYFQQKHLRCGEHAEPEPQQAKGKPTRPGMGVPDRHHLWQGRGQKLGPVEEALVQRFIDSVGDEHVPLVSEAKQRPEMFVPVGLPQTIIHPRQDAASILDEVSPSFIVLYDPELETIRQIEVYKAEHPGIPVRVYFMTYDNSVEQQRYLNRVEKETLAFKNMIRTKATMSVSNLDDVQDVEDEEVPKRSTRKGGALVEERPAKRRKIVVDVREFRCVLPSLLYQGAIDVVPVTLTVGDFVLSRTMCVERKSVSDLFSSLNSGRLYTQAEAMSRSYDTPILLIEFDQAKSFSLQSVNALTNHISESNIVSKLVLLALHFPRLRIVWCRSPHMAVQVFKTLKEHEEEPDESQAIQVGVPQDEDAAEHSRINTFARDFLLKLPGVDLTNCYRLSKAMPDLASLANASVADLGRILGKLNAQLLHDFFHHKFTN